MSYDYGDDCGFPCGLSQAEIDFEKDPDEIIDYAVDFSPELGSDVIVDAYVTLPDGLTQVSAQFADGKVQIFVEGGTCGRIYRMVFRMTSSGGRIYKKVLRVRVVEY